HLQLIVSFQNVRLPFPTSKTFPIHKSLQPGEMAVDGDGIIAAMDHAAEEWFAKTFGNVASANRNIEGAGVAVQILEAFNQADKNVEIFRIEEATFGAAMSGDSDDAAFQRQGQ